MSTKLPAVAAIAAEMKRQSEELEALLRSLEEDANPNGYRIDAAALRGIEEARERLCRDNLPTAVICGVRA